MNRKYLLLTLCLPVLLTACGKRSEEQIVVVSPPPLEVSELLAEDISEKDSFPVPENAVAAADGVRLVTGYDEDGNPQYGEALKAGQSIKVHTLGTKMCLVETQGGMGVVPRWEVLLFGERGYQTWKGSAAKGAPVYSDSELSNESRVLKRKTQVSVLYALGDWLYVEINGEYCFMNKSDVTAVRKNDPAPVSTATPAPDDWTPPMY